MTQETLAERMGISDLTVKRLEVGRSPVDLRYVEAAAKALDYSVENFLTSLFPENSTDEDILHRLTAALVERGVSEYEDYFRSGELMGLVADLAKLPARDRSALARLVGSSVAWQRDHAHQVVRENLVAGAASPRSPQTRVKHPHMKTGRSSRRKR